MDDRRYLRASEVDYTLCTLRAGEYRPLLNIEFDGYSHGLSRDGRYIAVEAQADPKRAQHLDLKVRVATQAGYPLFVVSYEETNPIGKKTHLTILDGIVGQVLAGMAFEHELRKRMAKSQKPACDTAFGTSWVLWRRASR